MRHEVFSKVATVMPLYGGGENDCMCSWDV